MKKLQEVEQLFDEQFPILTDEIDSKNRFARTVGGDVKHFIREQVTAIVSQIGVEEKGGTELGIIMSKYFYERSGWNQASQEVERQKQIILNGEKG